MSDDSMTKANQLGERYSDLKKASQVDDSVIERKRSQITKLSYQLQQFHETDTTRPLIQEQIEKIESELDSVGRAITDLEDTKKELLEFTASSFVILPGNPTPSESYFRAITDILTGQEKTKLEFDKCTISLEKCSFEGENDIDKLIAANNVSIFIKEAAKRALGKTNILDKIQEKIKSPGISKLFRVFTRHDEPLTVVNIKSIINEPDWDEEKIGDAVTNLLRDERHNHKLIRRLGKKGKYQQYQISDAGRILNQFFPSEKNEKEKNSELQQKLTSLIEKD